MSTTNGQVISIFECQSILKLQDFTPEELVDRVFGNHHGFRLGRDEFKDVFKRAFPHILKEKAELVNDALERVFTLSDRDCDNFLDVDEFGKGVGIFTSKRLSNNPTRDFFYYLDKDFRGFINEKEVNEFLTTLTNRGIKDPNLNVDVQAIFNTIHKSDPNSRNKDTTYWQFYRWRNMDQIKKLESLFSTSNSQSGSLQVGGARTLPQPQTQPPASRYVGSTTPKSATTSTVTNVKPSFSSNYEAPIVQQQQQPAYRPQQSMPQTYQQSTVKATTTQPVSQLVSQPVSQPVAQTRVQSRTQPQTQTQLLKNSTLGNPQPSLNDLRGSQIVDTVFINSFEELVQMAQVTGIATINAKDLVKALMTDLNQIYNVTLDQFLSIFTEMFKGKYRNYYQFKEQLTGIFNFLDTNGNGVLDIEEIMHGFVHMGAGTQRDKIEAAFMIIDRDGSGFVDYQELYFYFKQVFAVTLPNTQNLPLDKFEEELNSVVLATVEDVFKTVDLNGDQQVSFEEFVYWFEQQGGDKRAYEDAKKKRVERQRIIDEANKPPRSFQDIKKELKAQNAYTATVEELRSMIPFHKIHIMDALNLYQEKFNMESIPYQDFIRYIEELVNDNGLDIGNKTLIKDVGSKLFRMFDDNGDSLIDLHELATGFALLCGGTSTEKLRAAFLLHDRNQSDSLDFPELVQFMETIFRIIGHNNPVESIRNTKPVEFAQITAMKCFKDIGLAPEGALMYDDFKTWFQS